MSSSVSTSGTGVRRIRIGLGEFCVFPGLGLEEFELALGIVEIDAN